MKKHYTLLTGMIFFLLVKLATAQNLHVSTDSLEIAGGTTVEINGSFITDANTATQNIASILRLTGDFNADPNSSYTSTGTEEFFGPGIQNINFGISGTNYFGHWVKNNGDDINVFGDIDCDSATFLTNRFINATSNIITIRIKSGLITAIKGYNSSRYFLFEDDQSSLSRKITLLGNYVFPVGTPTAGYRRFDITTTSLGVTGTSFVNAKLKDYSPGTIDYHQLFTTGFNGSFPGICTVGSNRQWVEFTCMTDHYWKLSGPSDYRFKTYAYAIPCSPPGQGPRRVLKSAAPTGDWSGNVTNVIGTLTTELCENSDWTAVANPIPGGTYQGFGDFAIAGSTGATLPITLMYLTATPQTNSILVQWATASELNNDYFNLQRSTDAKEFTTIGWFDGHGTTPYPNTYNYDDKGVVSGVMYYYRLESVDFDGTKHYSEIVNAIIKGKIATLLLSPNLTTGTIHAQEQVAKVVMYDVSGRELQTFMYQSDFSIQNFANGMYFFTVTTADGLIYPGIKITLQK
jgi:hypothetical protein